MRDLVPIHRAIEWIEARLKDEVSVADMAAVAGYSLFHFIRTFDQSVHHTPYDYLMRRRLAEAARELVCSGRRVVDIALEYRFGNHETFSRAFKRLFGMQPTQWRERGSLPHQALMPPFSLAYLEHIHQPAFQRPQVIAQEARCLVGLMTQLALPLTGQPAAVERLWDCLGRALALQSTGEAAGPCFGVKIYIEGLPGQAQADAGPFYLAAVEGSAFEPYHPLLVSHTLPEGEYVHMLHPGPLENLPLTLDFLYHTWLPKAGLRPSRPLEVFFFEERPCGENISPGIEAWLPVSAPAPQLPGHKMMS